VQVLVTATTVVTSRLVREAAREAETVEVLTSPVVTHRWAPVDPFPFVLAAQPSTEVTLPLQEALLRWAAAVQSLCRQDRAPMAKAETFCSRVAVAMRRQAVRY
jgi:hypothetical protein